LLLLHLAEAGFPFELINLVLCLLLVCFTVSLLILKQPVHLLHLSLHLLFQVLFFQRRLRLRLHSFHLLFQVLFVQRRLRLRLHSFHLLLQILPLSLYRHLKVSNHSLHPLNFPCGLELRNFPA
jgi:hypothetical protein